VEKSEEPHRWLHGRGGELILAACVKKKMCVVGIRHQGNVTIKAMGKQQKGSTRAKQRTTNCSGWKMKRPRRCDTGTKTWRTEKS